MRTNIAHNDAFSGQENDQVQQELLDTVSDLAFENPADDAVAIDNNYAISNKSNSIIHDDDLNEKNRSLNRKHRQILDIIHDWEKGYVKNLQARMPVDIRPIYVFITRNGGCGKSHLIRTIYHSLTKTLSNRAMSSYKPKVLLLVPTGVAAINIDGTTIHTTIRYTSWLFWKKLAQAN